MNEPLVIRSRHLAPQLNGPARPPERTSTRPAWRACRPRSRGRGRSPVPRTRSTTPLSQSREFLSVNRRRGTRVLPLRPLSKAVPHAPGISSDVYQERSAGTAGRMSEARARRGCPFPVLSGWTRGSCLPVRGPRALEHGEARARMALFQPRHLQVRPDEIQEPPDSPSVVVRLWTASESPKSPLQSSDE